jgi:hypothetical protein
MRQLPLMSAAAGLRIVMARYGQCDGPVRSTEGCEGTSKPQKDKNIRSAVFLEGNEDPKPFAWTKTADEILDRLTAYLQRIPDAGH